MSADSEVLTLISEGSNIFMHGPGGTGKTYTLNRVYSQLNMTAKRVLMTALTGIAAINLKHGTTLHSALGIGLAKGTPEEIVRFMSANGRRNARYVDLLIIDEISMMGKTLLDKIDAVLKIVRKSDAPMGGMRVVFSGDFFQLPPVKDSMAFESPVWKALKLKTVEFNEPKRYEDPDFYEMLMRIRKGIVLDEDHIILMHRKEAHDGIIESIIDGTFKERIVPTIFFALRKMVKTYNDIKMKELETPSYISKCVDRFPESIRESWKPKYIERMDAVIDPEIEYKVGQFVMLTRNMMHLSKRLVNGARGIIQAVNMDEEMPRIIKNIAVAFENIAGIVEIEPVDTEFSSSKDPIIRTQMPLISAWALTIHKSQGATIESAIVDVGSSVFEDGQAYVALSRVRDIKGLYLSDYNRISIHANPKVLEFFKGEEV